MRFDSPDMSVLSRLRTRQLLLLNALDEQRNLGRAALAMSMSQPAATKLLQQLESAMGVSLFTRLARGMEPTPYGEVLVRYARRMLTDFGAVREEMVALKSGLRGSLRIGCVPGAVTELLAPALVAYKALHTKVAVSIMVDTSDVMLTQLARGDVDLVLGRLTDGVNADEYTCEPLLGELQVVVARAVHPLFDRSSLSLSDLVTWPWVLQPPGSPQRGRFEAALREAGLHQRLNITETASTIATTALLEISDMVAVMPKSLAGHYSRLGVLKVLPLALPIHVPPIYLITRTDRTPSPASTQFIKAIYAASPRI